MGEVRFAVGMADKVHGWIWLHCFSSICIRRTLADIIMEKITEKQTEVETVMSEISGRPMPQLDPRVLEVYKGVREVSVILL